jgi:hypothetical protein
VKPEKTDRTTRPEDEAAEPRPLTLEELATELGKLLGRSLFVKASSATESRKLR